MLDMSAAHPINGIRATTGDFAHGHGVWAGVRVAAVGSAPTRTGNCPRDRFGDWNEFVEAVEAADPTIAVVGITDYASVRTTKLSKSATATGACRTSP